ncbi:MAG: hypothetical protein EOP83_20550 [Verrucomicrobiaceae bacterium]|nr:MAG: hypothetical protein EOP83_20550 [Verrucomicrobiaceae bacterium]
MSDVTENTVTEEAPISLSLNDIQNAVKVIDFAAEQGAFKGWKTIEQVLNVRQRLNAFLEVAQAQAPEATESEASEEVAETTEG